MKPILWMMILFAGGGLLAQTITMQPTNQIVPVGGSVTFSVAVGGGPFTYVWQRNGTNLPNNIITTVAGNGSASDSGDGGLATNAGIYRPFSVGFDPQFNLYIADLSNYVRKVDGNGIITKVAGNGIAAYGGDGGLATNASFNAPDGVTADANGNLYISDYFNNRVRFVGTNGIITTFAGNGNVSPLKDGYPATNLNSSIDGPAGVAFNAASAAWYISDENHNLIRVVSSNGILNTFVGSVRTGGRAGLGGDGGYATNALLNYPGGIAFDSAGNLYIADQSNNRVRKVSTNDIITTFAGNGSIPTNGIDGDDNRAATNASLDAPSDVVADSVGDIFIADYGHWRVRKVDTNGIITTVAGTNQFAYTGDGGAATNAAITTPAGLALDPLGNLCIADEYNNRIREVHLAGLPYLTLSNVDETGAGNYSVIIAGSAGSITSNIARLTPVTPPPIVAPTRTVNGQFQFGFGSQTNVNYTVQYSTNLTQWIALETLGGNGMPLLFVSTNSPSGMGFYRIALSPQ